METAKSSHSYGAAHMIERQMLLHYARAKAAMENAAGKQVLKYKYITISRDKGSLGDEIAQDLSRLLGWRVFDREIVDYISKNSHVRQNLVQQLDERAQNMIHESVQRLLRMAEGGAFGIDEYHEALLKTLAFLAAQGDAIIVGRGANYALRDGAGLHVRIMASDKVRVDRLAKRWNISAEETNLRMQELDAEKRSFIRRHFKHDPNDLRFFDLVFITDFLTPRQIAASVLGVLDVSQTVPYTSSDNPRLLIEKAVVRAQGA